MSDDPSCRGKKIQPWGFTVQCSKVQGKIWRQVKTKQLVSPSVPVKRCKEQHLLSVLIHIPVFLFGVFLIDKVK